MGQEPLKSRQLELGLKPPTDSVRFEGRKSATLQEILSHKPSKPQSIIVFTDANQNADDLAAFLPLAFLHQEGFVSLDAVVTTRGSKAMRKKRARHTKAVFESLGLPQVPVGAGMTYRRASFPVFQNFLTTQLMSPKKAVHHNGLAMAQEALAKADDKNVTLTAISGLTDLAALMKSAPNLVRAKVNRIVLMSSADAGNLDENRYVTPDKRASNNRDDFKAARDVFKHAQAWNIPLTVVTKEAANKVVVKQTLFDKLAALGHKAGQELKAVQKEAVKILWDDVRLGKRDTLTMPWFYEIVLKLDAGKKAHQQIIRKLDSGKPNFDKVWDVYSINYLYDPLAVLAAVPGVSNQLFNPKALSNTGVSQIGAEEILDPAKVKAWYQAMAKEALRQQTG